MSIKIFISRKLNTNSPIAKWCLDNKVDILDFPLIKIKPIRNQDIPASDWIFFLSPNGVNVYMDHYELKAENIAVYGQGTNRELNKRGYKADFIGDNMKSSEQIGTAFFEFIHPNAIVLFPISDISRGSIMKKNITNTCHEVVIYRNLPASKRIRKVDIAILTSPSNIDAYFKSNFNKDTKFIVLGETSLNYFTEKYNYVEVHMTKASTEEAIIPIVHRLWTS
ncbi:MAG: uroporphyrinogen-III synthase [Crocinitomicaceae bacterium]